MYVDVSDLYVDSDEHDEIEEKDKCCVCRTFEPDTVRKSVSLICVKGVQCDKCEHWTHLMFVLMWELWELEVNFCVFIVSEWCILWY